MMAEEEEKSLEDTPTWAVAAVCAVFVVVSLMVERGLKYLGRHLKNTKKKELSHTLGQIKDELMLLGFISLSLTVFQKKIASMCMPERFNHFMLPCSFKPASEGRISEALGHRVLWDAGPSVTCPPGKVQVISIEGLHQLHIFIFVMAIVHVVYSAVTVLLGLWQVHSWKNWEANSVNEYENSMKKALDSKNYDGANTKDRMLLTSDTSLHFSHYFYSFFKQFGKPISEQDYLCLRYGFITHHNLNPNFDFHSYIKRSMERDFEHVVGISYYLWVFVCIYLLVDIDGWYSYFWLAFVPLVMVLFVGTKLQLIVTSLVLRARTEASDKDDLCGSAEDEDRGVKTCPGISPRDDLFWFKSPRLLLFLVHFILFQNAFELAFFFWTMVTYGYSSCLVGKTWMVVVRILVGFFLQVLCSISTLPLYALVTQLGSNMKLTVFRSESTGAALSQWAKSARMKHSHSQDHSHERVAPHEHHHIGILGLTKDYNDHGNLVNITPGTRLHHGRGHADHHEGHKHSKEAARHHHPHHHAHLHKQDGSHTVEISEHSVVSQPTKIEPFTDGAEH
ncbi:MLO-like protein 15 isoform X1 [Physcomitrium patens]|uniref:MLO-like protein n=1 Tax=Physcomitrium patens TaxID=3218 RepID=A0A2K1K2R0_PHYPA|nr:MLO-like protein 15 isoform X1 [Physcomitrium patens]XP_024384763.1 MLO-like protein 15 isoform X1 [Physcomitrium patens]PNR48062.1 hypothetical protein PHYPA_012535 [Physcomitrium patens]|eukprot:XP_024384762.1 MLO-like protein 15 isoform X1 [Physcomitrella patens]